MMSSAWLRCLAVLSAALVVGTGLSGCDFGNSVAPTATAPSWGQVASGTSAVSVTVSWMPPDQNTNGTAITDLAGYHIHYGSNPAALTHQVDVPTTGITDYVIDGLQSGHTYYFAVSSYNGAGVESGNSAVVSFQT